MERPLISVIIPVYNVEKYLAECLDSCICQNAGYAEFICVDDGSTDSSAKILEEYSKKDARIKTLGKPNGGLSSARNAGISVAEGEWIMFLDSDDKFKENALQTIKERIGSGSSKDIIIYCADTFPANIETEGWYKKTLQFQTASYGEFTSRVLFGERGSMPYVWRQAYRREALRQSKVTFDESVKYGEDVLFQMEVFPQCTGFDFITDVLVSYRLNREGSIMNNVQDDALKTVDNHFEMIKHVAEYWKEKGWITLYGGDFLYWVLKFTILKVRALPSELRREKATELLEKIITPFGLDEFKRELRLKGKAMWTAFHMMSRFRREEK